MRPQYGDFRKQSTSDDIYYASYQTPKPLEQLTELPFKSRWISDNQPWNHHSASSQTWLEESRPEPPKAESPRDSRMGLNNLLN
jgi:Myb-like DNA-binding protein FlbD